MWTRRVLVALLTAASVVGVQLVSAPAVQAAPDPKLQVTGVTLDRASVAVSDLNTVAVQIRVTGGYDSDEPILENMPLNVWLKRTSGTGPRTLLLSTDLPRVSGTTQNGVWAGPVYVPSTANGVFTVFGVTQGPLSFYESGPMPPDPTPVAGPALTVNGSHLPKITAKVTPSIVPFGSGFSITWAVTDSATGKPYATRVRVLLGIDNQCDSNQGGDSPLTSTSGTVTKAYPASAGDALLCLRIHGARIWDIAALHLFVARPGIVSAVPSKTSAPVGTPSCRSRATFWAHRRPAKCYCNACTARASGARSTSASSGRVGDSRCPPSRRTRA